MGRINTYTIKGSIVDDDTVLIIDSEIEDPSSTEALKQVRKSTIKEAIASDYELAVQESEEVEANTPKLVEHNRGRVVSPIFVTPDGRLASLYVYDVTSDSFMCESTVSGTVYYK